MPSRTIPAVLAAVAMVVAACGSSDAEIQERIDLAVAEALDTTTTSTLAPNAGSTCRDYRAALAATEIDYDTFLAIERRLLAEALEAYKGVEIADGWLGEYVYWSAEQEVASMVWQTLSEARPPEIVEGRHADLIDAAWAYSQAVGDVWGAAALTLPESFGTTSIPTEPDWESLLEAFDEAFTAFESLRVVASATCSV